MVNARTQTNVKNPAKPSAQPAIAFGQEVNSTPNMKKISGEQSEQHGATLGSVRVTQNKAAGG